jgi:hypothetical protein
MLAKESVRPFVMAGGRAAATERRRAKRTIWECPVTGCPRVQAAADEDLDELDEELGE